MNLEKVFALLDSRLVSFGVPGALVAVGIAQVREGRWWEAIGCLAAAAGVGIVIKVGKKLAPKLDQLLDGGIAATERSFLAITSDFTGQFLRQQAQLNEEFTTAGFNPDRTTIPLLEDVFVPL